MRSVFITSVVWLSLVSMFCSSGSAAASAGAPSPADSQWWFEAARNLEAHEYAIGESPAGLQAPNRKQDLRTYFRSHGIEAVPRTGAADSGAWHFQWRTTAWGREGDLQSVGGASTWASATRPPREIIKS